MSTTNTQDDMEVLDAIKSILKLIPLSTTKPGFYLPDSPYISEHQLRKLEALVTREVAAVLERLLANYIPGTNKYYTDPKKQIEAELARLHQADGGQE